MTIIRIKNLRLRAIIGANESERKNKQDLVINVVMEIDSKKALRTDNIEDTCDYKTITKKIINHVERSKYFLLEKLAGEILGIALEDKKVKSAAIEVDKPGALRFSDSVSVEVSAKK